MGLMLFAPLAQAQNATVKPIVTVAINRLDEIKKETPTPAYKLYDKAARLIFGWEPRSNQLVNYSVDYLDFIQTP